MYFTFFAYIFSQFLKPFFSIHLIKEVISIIISVNEICLIYKNPNIKTVYHHRILRILWHFLNQVYANTFIWVIINKLSYFFVKLTSNRYILLKLLSHASRYKRQYLDSERRELHVMILQLLNFCIILYFFSRNTLLGSKIILVFTYNPSKDNWTEVVLNLKLFWNVAYF